MLFSSLVQTFFFSLYHTAVFLKQFLCLYVSFFSHPSCLTSLFWTLLLSQRVISISFPVCVNFMDVVAKRKLKYCSCGSLSYLVCFPSDDLFFSFAFSPHSLSICAPFSPLCLHLHLPLFSTFVYLKGIQSCQREERVLEMRLWRVDLSHWCWL